MEKNFGMEGHEKTAEQYKLSADRFEAEVQKIRPETKLSRAYLISRMAPNYKELSSTEVGRINAILDPLIKHAVEEGYLKPDAVNPDFGFTRTDKVAHEVRKAA